MKNIKISLINILVALSALFLMSSCVYKPLYLDGIDLGRVKVKVSFDWSNITTEKAKTIKLWMFPKDGGAPIVYPFADWKGGEISIRPGEYKAVWTNYSSERIKFKDTNNWSDFSVYTGLGTSVNPYANLSDEDRTKINPNNDPVSWDLDNYYSGVNNNVDIHLPTPDEQELVFKVKPKMCHYTVEVKGLKNFKFVGGSNLSNINIIGAVTGLAAADMPTQGNVDSQPANILFNAIGIKPSGPIQGEFNTFGVNPKNKEHYLVLFFTLPDNSNWYAKIDVSDQVNNAKDPCNVHIVVDELILPLAIVNGHGWKPTVDTWKNAEEVHINMPY